MSGNKSEVRSKFKFSILNNKGEERKAMGEFETHFKTAMRNLNVKIGVLFLRSRESKSIPVCPGEGLGVQEIH